MQLRSKAFVEMAVLQFSRRENKYESILIIKLNVNIYNI